MTQTITVKQSDFKKIIKRISKLESQVTNLLKMFRREPRNGTKEWWNWAHAQGLNDKKQGDYYVLEDAADIDDFFNNLENDRYLFNKFHNKSKKTDS